jgi:hypothetical protein
MCAQYGFRESIVLSRKMNTRAESHACINAHSHAVKVMATHRMVSESGWDANTIEVEQRWHLYAGYWEG